VRRGPQLDAGFLFYLVDEFPVAGFAYGRRGERDSVSPFWARVIRQSAGRAQRHLDAILAQLAGVVEVLASAATFSLKRGCIARPSTS
jgi:hypothetical protein